jgi:hypothetical protein
MSVVLAASGAGLDGVLSRLTAWSAAGYLAPFVWAEPDEIVLIERGARDANELAGALDGRSDGAYVVGIALPDDQGRIGSAAVEHVRRIQAQFAAALPGTIPPAPTVVYFPLTDETAIEPAPEGSVRSAFVAVPEDLSGPLEANLFDPTNAECVASHVAHATAALTGILGNASSSLLTPSPDETAEEHRPPVSFVRCHSRVIDGGYLPDALAARAFSVSGGSRWPNPDLGRYERIELPGDLLQTLAHRYLDKHEDVFGLRPVELPEAPQEVRLPLLEALKAIGRFVLAEIRQRPTAWIDERLEHLWERRLLPAVEGLYPASGVKLARYRPHDGNSSTAEQITAQFAEPVPTDDGATAPAWHDFIRLASCLIDGENVPIQAEELEHGRLRSLDTRPGAIVPRFDDFPPLNERPPRVCDPRLLDPLIRRQIEEHDAAVVAQTEAQPGEDPPTPAEDPSDGATPPQAQEDDPVPADPPSLPDDTIQAPGLGEEIAQSEAAVDARPENEHSATPAQQRENALAQTESSESVAADSESTLAASLEEGAPTDPVEAARIEALRAWWEASRRTLLWQIGQLLGAAIDDAHAEADTATPSKEEHRQLDERIAAARQAEAATGSHRRHWLLARTLVALALCAWIVLGDLPILLKPVAVIVVLFIWILLGTVAWWRHRHRRWRNRHGHPTASPEIDEEVETFIQRTLVGATRRSDCERLLARYGEYLDWAEVASQLLHRPWFPRTARNGGPGEQLAVPDPDTFPHASTLAYAHFSSAQLARVSAVAEAAAFAVGWLTHLIDDAIAVAAAEWLALHPSPDSDQSMAPDGTPILPDPYGEQNRDRENLRAAVVDSVCSGRGRGIDTSAYLERYLQRVGDEPVTELLTDIREPATAADCSPLPPAPELFGLPGRISTPGISTAPDEPENGEAYASLAEFLAPLISRSETYVGEHGTLGSEARKIATSHLSPPALTGVQNDETLAAVSIAQASTGPLRIGEPLRVTAVRIDQTAPVILETRHHGTQLVPWFELARSDSEQTADPSANPTRAVDLDDGLASL